MWKLIIVLLLNFVFTTKQSVEKPLNERQLEDDDFMESLREYLKDKDNSEVLRPSFMASSKRSTQNAKQEKTPFMFTVKYKQFVLVSASTTVKFNCSTNDPQATYKLVHELAMPPYIKKTLTPDGDKLKQNGAIFLLKGVNLHDGGKYYCMAKNPHGEEITQQPLMLFVSTQIFQDVRPSVNPSLSFSELGDDVTFTCRAKGLGYSLKWELENENGVYVEAPLEMVSELPSRTNQGYIIQSIRLTLEDVRPPPYPQNYRCCLDFQGDLRYSYAKLEVKAPEKPKITNLPTYIGITEGSDFEFTCHASGSPPPIIMWSKDGEIIESCNLTGTCYLKGKNYIISGEHNEVLRLEKVTMEANSGNIVCHAMNMLGMDEDVTMIRIYDEDYTPTNHHSD